MFSERLRAIAPTSSPTEPAAGSLPAAPVEQAPSELRSWLRRLHETATDLSRRVADQEERLDRLTTLLEAAQDRPAPAPSHQLVAFPAPGVSSRWRRLAGRLLRAPGALARRFQTVARSRWILPVADESQAPPLLRLREEVLPIELSGGVADLPAGYLELALRTLAAEDLFFLELRGRTDAAGADLELWLCRREWPWRSAADLGRKLAALPPGGPLLGRRIVLDGDPHAGAGPAALADFEIRAEYWLRPGAPGGIELRARLGRPAGSPADSGPSSPGRVAIVATRPLDGGLEVWTAAALRALSAQGRETLLAATWDLRASHRSLAEVAPRGVPLYPLATFAAPELRAALLARLLESAGVDTLIQVGPGEGVFDQPALQELLGRCRVVDLPLPILPGAPLALGRPAGQVDRTLDLAAGDLPLPAAGHQPRGAAARAAARERLGVPPGAFLACQVADLVPGERPEDLVELAHRCPDIFFLQVGRGGLAGRRDDLLRFRGAANVRCLSGADLGEVLAAADVVLALGEPSVWPFPVFAALAAGIPVLGRPAGPLAPYAGRLRAAVSLAEIAAALGEPRPEPAPPPAAADSSDMPVESLEAALGRQLL